MCIKIQIKVCICLDEGVWNLIYTLLKKTSITCNGNYIHKIIQKFLTV